MADILTLTINPALDVLTTIERVEPVHKMRCDSVIKHPGGGGVNVARVLHRLGADCLAVYPAGGITGERHHKMLKDEQVPCHVVSIAQETRENFSVHEHVTNLDYRFVLPGPALSAQEHADCFDFVAQHLPRQFLVLSGGLAPGVPDDFHAQLVRLARARGLRVVVDTNGPALNAALREGVYLFKPNQRELETLTGSLLSGDASILAAARQLIQSGQSELVAVSLGEDGAMLVSADQAWRAQSLPVPVRTTIGAGDSFVGGMVWSLSQGHTLPQAFRYAMAAASAALLGQGTALCEAADVHRMATEVNVQPLAV